MVLPPAKLPNINNPPTDIDLPNTPNVSLSELCNLVNNLKAGLNYITNQVNHTIKFNNDAWSTVNSMNMHIHHMTIHCCPRSHTMTYVHSSFCNLKSSLCTFYQCYGYDVDMNDIAIKLLTMASSRTGNHIYHRNLQLPPTISWH